MTPKLAQLRIRRTASSEDPAFWRDALARVGQATTLKADTDDSWVRRLTLPDERLAVIKCRPLVSSGDRLKARLGQGRARRHWRNARWLANAGIRTATPYAIATARQGNRPVELLAMEHLPGRTLLEHLHAPHPCARRQHRIARAAGATVARLDALQRYNRDHKPSNLIVVDEASAPRTAIIDCVAIRRGRNLERMLTSLLLEPIGCACPARRALWFVALHAVCRGDRPFMRDCIATVSERIEAHGDPTPHVNPLDPEPA